jgi:hypothetical protein
MTQSPFVEEGMRLLAAGARPWEEPDRCAHIVAGLRGEGHTDLANRLEEAARKPHAWGTSTI